MTKLQEITKFTPTFWRVLGEKVINTIRIRVQKRHTNAKGEKFAPYSNKFAGVGWRTLEVGGKNQPVFLDSYKNKKMAGKATAKGVPQASRSGVPDMTLTGKTMAAFQVHNADKDSVIIGWTGEPADIVKHLHGMKNYKVVGLTGQILTKGEVEFIERNILLDMNGRINKFNKEDITINIEL